MSLLDTLTAYCADQFFKYGDCLQCSHPSGRCSGSCLNCSEEVNFHKTGGRTDYDCQKFMYYYVCRYSWKYCSEIMYALEQISLSDYPAYNILSVGCGGAPDLMAFEEIMSVLDMKNIFYKGYDVNPFWSPIHRAIEQYTLSTQYAYAELITKDIFDALRGGELVAHNYNIIVLEYLLSHFPPQNRANWANELFDGLLQNVLPNRLDKSPFLFLINDIDHFQVRDCFDVFLQKLKVAGYHGSYMRKHFRDRDYNDGSTQYSTWNNRFPIPETMKENFDCAINCTSAQLIVEVQ